MATFTTVSIFIHKIGYNAVTDFNEWIENVEFETWLTNFRCSEMHHTASFYHFEIFKFCIIKIFIIGSLHNSLHHSCVSHISINSQLNEFQLAFEARNWSRKETHTWEISVIRYQVFIWCSDVIMRIKTHTSIICFPLKYYLSSKLLLFINIYC